MAVPNPKGTPENLVNLRKRSKEERKEIASKGGTALSKKRNEKKNICEVASDFLNAKISPAEAKKRLAKLKFEIAPEQDENINLRVICILELVEIIISEDTRPDEKMKAIKMLSEYARELPEQLAAEAEKSKHRMKIGDDPFSKSIKALIKGGSEEE